MRGFMLQYQSNANGSTWDTPLTAHPHSVPSPNGSFLLLFYSFANVSKHRRCDLYNSPGFQPGVEMAHPPGNPEAMSYING